MITCSGAYTDGSLRVVRNGIGIAEVAQLEMPEVQGVWPLKASLADAHHSLLAFSLVGQTAFLSVCSDDELEAIQIPGASPSESLYVGTVVDGCWVQVVQGEVLLLSSGTREATARWTPPDGKRISVCGPSTTHLVVACGADVWYLSLTGGAIGVVGHATLDHDVACLDITPIGGGGEAATAGAGGNEGVGGEPTFCLAGLWTDISVRVLELPGLREVHTELLGGEIIPRSAVLASLEDAVFVHPTHPPTHPPSYCCRSRCGRAIPGTPSSATFFPTLSFFVSLYGCTLPYRRFLTSRHSRKRKDIRSGTHSHSHAHAHAHPLR